MSHGPFHVPNTKQTPGSTIAKYAERLLKLIPAEVVGLYLAGAGFAERITVLYWIWAVFCLFAVFAVRFWGMKASSDSRQPVAITVACISYVIWIYAIGGPFEASNIYVPEVGSLLVLGWTFFVPMIYTGQDASG